MTTVALEESLSRRLARLDSQIKVEYELIGHRVSWLLVSNSFLFAAFVVALGNSSLDANTQKLIRILVLALPVIGLVSSVLVSLAVRAANEVVHELKKARDFVEEQASRFYEYERLGVHIKSWPHIVGNWPPALLPPLFAIVWLTLLYTRIVG